MKKLNKKYADLLHQASIATGRKEAVGLLHKAAKLQTKFDENSKFQKECLNPYSKFISLETSETVK